MDDMTILSDDANTTSSERIREARRQYAEWENSLDGVHYQIGGLFTSTDLKVVIVKTVQRLPPDVRQFVYDKCAFLQVDHDGGHALSIQANLHWDWIIWLGDKAGEAVVAHEIAHCWLEHRFPVGERPLEEVGPLEMAANNKAKGWGFDVQDMIDRDRDVFKVPDEGGNS